MKQYKIYTKGNYIVIVDVQKNEYFYGIRKEVHIDKSNVNKAIYRAFNVKDFSSSIILAVPNILKEDGTPYSEAEFDTFYQENTGNFNGGGSAPTVLSVTGNFVDNTDPLNPILNDPRPYKVYTALLTQSGSDAPVAIVLENTLGKIHWSRRFKGTYEGSLARAFTENKTTIQIIAHTGQGYTTNSSAVNKDLVEISTSNELDRTADNVLENTPIEIRVYN